MNFTLVTGLWDIKRGDLAEFGRSFDHYLENFENILSLDFNMCIYVPPELKSFVKSKRKDNNTTIITKEISSFRTEFPFFKKVNNIRVDISWYKKASWLENSPQALLEYYNPIVMSKFFMLHDNVVVNPFNTDYHFWIDGGLTNTVNLESLKNLSSVEDYMKSINNNMLFLSFPYISQNEVHGFDAKKFSEFCGVDQSKYVCRGGFFGGHKNKIRKFNTNYYTLLEQTLDAECMGTEENIHTIMSYKYPQEIYRYELEDNGLVYPFFEELAKVKKYDQSNANLISWEKNKPIEEIKTSLYVLTFNSPSQFEALIKSYEVNDPDFLRFARKILIDNSTDRSTYNAYQELCLKYGFEHIKKENNIGICGARQFIAEHFNESDSEYYIFLEDDMTLHSSTTEKCSSGYNRYVDNLYYKSLTIIHKNNYDYLKLSFSEFYGNNSIQWAWYNVPQAIRDQYFPENRELPKERTDSNLPKVEVLSEKRYKDLKYFEGEFYYCNWPLWFSRKGNRKVFLNTKWNKPYEQTWMSNVFQLQKDGQIKAGVLALSPILHERFDHYSPEERIES